MSDLIEGVFVPGCVVMLLDGVMTFSPSDFS